MAATSAIGKGISFGFGNVFGVIGAGLVVGRAGERVRIDGIDEAALDALILQRVGEKISQVPP